MQLMHPLKKCLFILNPNHIALPLHYDTESKRRGEREIIEESLEK